MSCTISGRFVEVLLALIALQYLSIGLNMSLFQFGGANFLKEFIYGGKVVLILLLNPYIDTRHA
jgi:hypothetical protein